MDTNLFLYIDGKAILCYPVGNKLLTCHVTVSLFVVTRLYRPACLFAINTSLPSGHWLPIQPDVLINCQS